MFHHKRGLKFQNIIFPRTLYLLTRFASKVSQPATYLGWDLMPGAGSDNRLKTISSSLTTRAMRQAGQLQSPSGQETISTFLVQGLQEHWQTMRWKYFFLKQERLWKLGVLSWGSSLWSPSHHRTPGFNSSELSSQKSFLVKMITNHVRIPRRHWRNLRWVIFHIIKYS